MAATQLHAVNMLVLMHLRVFLGRNSLHDILLVFVESFVRCQAWRSQKPIRLMCFH